jgi:hypothetical protein
MLSKLTAVTVALAVPLMAACAGAPEDEPVLTDEVTSEVEPSTVVVLCAHVGGAACVYGVTQQVICQGVSASSGRVPTQYVARCTCQPNNTMRCAP